MQAPHPTDEARRLEALRQCGVLQDAALDRYGDVTRLAAQICGASMAAVSLIDEERQWFLSAVGLGVSGTPRRDAFCAHAILRPDETLVVPDAALDDRFKDNPLVTGSPHLRFYAGAPLLTHDGFALGSLCVLDHVPRRLTPEQSAALRLLARLVSSQLETARRADEQQRLADERARLLDECDRLAAEREEAGAERARLAAIVESSDDAIASIDLDGLITSWNRSLERATGIPAAEALGRHISIIAAPDLVGLIAENNERMRRGEVIEPTEMETRGADGSRAYVMLTVSPIRDEAGDLVGSSSITRDITERRRAEEEARRAAEEARRSEARLAEAQRIARIGSWEMEMATERLTWSREMFRLLEFDPAAGEPSHEEFLGRFHPEDLPARAAAFAEALATGGQYRADVRVLLPSGRTLWCRSAGQPVQDAAGLAVRVVGTMMDITERKEAEQRLLDHGVVLEVQQAQLQAANAELAALATTDGLTGLANHRAFQERLAEEAGRAARDGAPLSLVLLDVDSFKQYNDAFGHPAGDDVLRAVARILRDCTRAGDLAARYGGEEFALILPRTGVGEAALVAERVRRALAGHPWPLRPVTASLGVASLGPAGDDTDGLVENTGVLIARADAALYRSKTGGRNRVTIDRVLTTGLAPAGMPDTGGSGGTDRPTGLPSHPSLLAGHPGPPLEPEPPLETAMTPS